MAAILTSDFDGTAVNKLTPRFWQPVIVARNMGKWGLDMISGYDDFVYGALSLGGIDHLGYLTVRKEWLRRRVTEKTIITHDLDAFGKNAGSVFYAGNESDKGKHLSEMAKKREPDVVGMLEDMPNKLVPELIRHVGPDAFRSDLDIKVVVGVVNHTEQLERIEQVVATTEGKGLPASRWGEIAVGETLGFSWPGFTLEIAALPPYSYDAGVEFGKKLLTT